MAHLLYGSDAHRDGKRFIVRADEELTAFLELEIDGFGRRVIFELPAVDLSKKATPPPSVPIPELAARSLLTTLAHAAAERSAQRSLAWRVTSLTNAPTGSDEHSAVWTGSEMIIWGGLGDRCISLNTGGKYCVQPASDHRHPAERRRSLACRQRPTDQLGPKQTPVI